MIKLSSSILRRFFLYTILSLAMLGGAYMILRTLDENLLYFYAPSEITDHHIKIGQKIRVGGLVVAYSHQAKGLDHYFQIKDEKQKINISYHGILPKLFADEEGIIVIGTWQGNNNFQAQEVLAKHDENYIPPELVKSIKQDEIAKYQSIFGKRTAQQP